ncbi:MAG: class I SAM-dependent methyltransferase [Nocardioidaceae bacterium]
MAEPPSTRWEQLTGGTSGADYAARFATLAASGADVHGEASFCAALVAPGSRVLDAGCGTGRVAIRLSDLGFEVVGVDVDDSMLAVAREQAPGATWLHGDLGDLPGDLLEGRQFDLVVLAGNVVPLLAEGTLPAAVRRLVEPLTPGGLLVAGFGLDAEHLPRGCPVTPLEEYVAAVTAAGLEEVERFSTWDAAAFDAAAGYAVTVHRRSLGFAP